MITPRSNRINVATDYLLNDYRFFSTHTQYQNADNFYYYDNSSGLYVLDAEGFIFDKLNEIFPNQFKHYSHIRDVINNIQSQSPIISIDQLNPSHITNYRNGLYYHKESKLNPHNPSIITTKQHTQNYVKESNNSLSQQAKRLEYLNYL
jgi:hypothetical protein